MCITLYALPNRVIEEDIRGLLNIEYGIALVSIYTGVHAWCK